ncbi:TetM/TetW/TetO/TetS family tetracycline resistance ribosomal protection protein [Tissierella sp. Yu-01]|uniref:GTP-binding protein n=1 Tax=Tissierella sp. Yu-01 TaxID=3035694 RepID=UPI00240E7DE1|nr:TetM/TetW/TetO/TetS family tetracycline resistance ribosomal protection protein [Tissierella sp. Yu-01]WFA08279.1 TetM/TetW/TetO/TetS family tetracycline resistance ribosomal protection protein [Tissierella sp. Yu-01]
MKKTIGILAHVDAGKTTFSEQLLYNTGSIRNIGRVDHQNSTLDTNGIEKKRGITIFADQGKFTYGEDTYYLIDTPGHMDFSAEMERAISILDYGILLISGAAGVQAHTTTLYKLLQTYRIPTFIFVNKSDMDSFNFESIMDDIKTKLTKDTLFISSIDSIRNMDENIVEFIAERNEEFMDMYFKGNYNQKQVEDAVIYLIKEQLCFPVMYGSALKGEGIDNFLKVFSSLTPTDYDIKCDNTFKGQVYKIRHDDKGNMITFMKATEGRLQVRNDFTFGNEDEAYKEKVTEIRIYNGSKYEVKSEVCAGDVFAVMGLKSTRCVTQHYLNPALQAKVNILDDTDVTKCIEKLRILEIEDPMLSVNYDNETNSILVSVMGRIQLEVLEQVVFTRFCITISFEKPRVQYRETILSPVVGYGHFEPLRHYAEVQLRLEPTPRGTGIIFSSECHVDTLALNYQKLIESHVFEKVHKGVLTGSPITDINIVLQDGRAHQKHTEGGDFREATYRAIRQGLEKAESILLEPFYKFEIDIEEIYLGRVISDIQRLRGTFKPPIQTGNNVSIKGRGPVESFMDYSMDLISFTKGTGNISLIFDDYDICENKDEVIVGIGYDKDRDVNNQSSSVFCSKGVSFTIPWDEAEEYMHTKTNQ